MFVHCLTVFSINFPHVLTASVLFSNFSKPKILCVQKSGGFADERFKWPKYETFFVI